MKCQETMVEMEPDTGQDSRGVMGPGVDQDIMVEMEHRIRQDRPLKWDKGYLRTSQLVEMGQGPGQDSKVKMGQGVGQDSMVAMGQGERQNSTVEIGKGVGQDCMVEMGQGE